MTALNKQALEHLTRKLTRRLNDAYGFSRTSKGKHTTITLSIGECRELIYVIESAWNRAEAAEKRIAELEAREVKLPKPISVLHRRDFNDAHRAIYAYPEAEVNAALAAAGIGVKGE